LENHFYYSHKERTDDAALKYTVLLSTNLASNVWKHAAVSEPEDRRAGVSFYFE
jgi:hypothetical protein